jgi:hypothetical protein
VKQKDIPISANFDGRTHSATYSINGAKLEVTCLYGVKVGELGNLPADHHAKKLLRDMLREAKKRGDL